MDHDYVLNAATAAKVRDETHHNTPHTYIHFKHTHIPHTTIHTYTLKTHTHLNTPHTPQHIHTLNTHIHFKHTHTHTPLHQEAGPLKSLHVVTSVGSNAKSPMLYPKTKGRTEDDLKALGLDQLSIYRPG